MNSERNMPEILIIGCKKPFLEFSKQLFDYETEIKKSYYDFIVMGETGSKVNFNISCGIAICPQSLKLNGKIKCGGVVTCGMNTRCTLSFSSIDYDKALLSINRRIDFDRNSIQQCEKPVDYYESLTIYENLVLQALNLLTI